MSYVLVTIRWELVRYRPYPGFQVRLNFREILSFKESNKEWFLFCVHCYLLSAKIPVVVMQCQLLLKIEDYISSRTTSELV